MNKTQMFTFKKKGVPPHTESSYHAKNIYMSLKRSLLLFCTRHFYQREGSACTSSPDKLSHGKFKPCHGHATVTIILK